MMYRRIISTVMRNFILKSNKLVTRRLNEIFREAMVVAFLETRPFILLSLYLLASN